MEGVEGDLQRTVGVNLRRYRQQRGLSQETFADLVGVHRTYMGELERGERNLTLRSVERVAETIGVDPVELLSLEIVRGQQRAEALLAKLSRDPDCIRAIEKLNAANVEVRAKDC